MAMNNKISSKEIQQLLENKNIQMTKKCFDTIIEHIDSDSIVELIDRYNIDTSISIITALDGFLNIGGQDSYHSKRNLFLSQLGFDYVNNVVVSNYSDPYPHDVTIHHIFTPEEREFIQDISCYIIKPTEYLSGIHNFDIDMLAYITRDMYYDPSDINGRFLEYLDDIFGIYGKIIFLGGSNYCNIKKAI